MRYGQTGGRARRFMEWNNTFKSMKEMENKALTDMTLLPTVEPLEVGLSSSEKASTVPPTKPRKKSMTSLYLKYFETAPDGKSRRCIFCRQSYSIATATGNLGRHLSHRHPGYDQQGETSQKSPQSITPIMKQLPQVKPATDFDNLNWLLLKWLIGSSLPPPTFEDETLLNSFRFLDPSAKLWTKEKVQAVTLEIFRSMREDIHILLMHVNSKVSISLDFWTSYEQLFYMGVRCHWIDENWSLHKVLLDVTHIPYPCTGPEIYHALMKVLQAFNIDKRILFCTNDGTQHAVYACHTLKEELDARNVPFCYIPCAARTLNLLIEDGLRSPKPILSKIREFALEMNSAPEIAQDFKQLTAIYREGLWKFPLDTSPSWNGDYTMLDIARKAPISMDSTLKKHEETFSTRNLSLNATEKSIVNILHSFLESFHKISTNLCTCKSPTIGLVLFFMDHVFEMIASCHDNYHQEWLKSVANDMVNRARSFTSQVYNLFTFIAAVLDPRIKKELIPDSLNSDDNLEEARIHFQRNYSTTLVPLVANGLGSHAAEEATVISFAEEIARKRRRGNVNVASDELSQYLSEPPLALATDVLDWWKANGCRYPCLSVMARDFLAVQGIAAEPEELFTNKGDEIRRHKFCLPYSSMQTVMCINEWAKGGFKLKYRSTEIDFDKLEFRSSEVDAVKP